MAKSVRLWKIDDGDKITYFTGKEKEEYIREEIERKKEEGDALYFDEWLNEVFTAFEVFTASRDLVAEYMEAVDKAIAEEIEKKFEEVLIPLEEVEII